MLAAKFIAAALVFAGYLLLPGCVTVGYDFLKQQATVTVTPSTKGLRKVSNVARGSRGYLESCPPLPKRRPRRICPPVSTTSFTVEQPLTSYDERKVHTPNKGNKVIIPEAVVLHHSATAATGAAVEWIASPASPKCPTTSSSPATAAAPCSAKTPNAPGTPERATGSAGKTLTLGASGSLGKATLTTTRLGDDAMASAIEYLVPKHEASGASR
jgi:hypothetical protein